MACRSSADFLKRSTMNFHINRKTVRLILCSIPVSLGVFFSSFSMGQGALVAGLGEGDVIHFGNNSTVGWAFTPSVDIRVDAAGILDAGGRGLLGQHVVSIWHADSEERLASTSLTRLRLHKADDTGNIFLPLEEALTLTSGVKYIVSTHITYISEPFYNSRSGDVEFSSAITVDSGRRWVSSSEEDVFPSDSSDFVGTVVGPNFRFTIIPEPSSSLLLVASISFLSIRRRGGNQTV